LIIDEPENGLDPQQQLRLHEQISGYLSNPKDIALVATNSLPLYYSNLPRIDLGQDSPFKVSYEKRRIFIK
jgi:predicted ATPase